LGQRGSQKIKKKIKPKEKVEVLELDEMCINWRKNIWLWTAVDRKKQSLVGFQVGTRETKYFEKLSQKIAHIDAKIYATDGWESYNLINPDKHIVGKAHTSAVERMNRLLRHYLARFARKTYCWSKSLEMIENSVLLFMNRSIFV
jgi:IS1 family transposase